MTAFTTKTAVYALIRGFPGEELLVWLGAIMAVYGVVYAVLENDARRLLAYHIISQVGYMVCGVGIGTELALNGAAAHAFAHILYKGLLFMGAGAVLEVTGLRKLSDMGGLYKTMPITLGLYMVGAFSISAVPLFSGFVSKSMVVSAAGENHRARDLSDAHVGVRGNVPAHRAEASLLHVLRQGFGRARSRAAREHARGHGSGGGCLHRDWRCSAALVRRTAVPGGLSPVRPAARDRHAGDARLHGARVLPAAEAPRPRAAISLDTDWFYRKARRSFCHGSKDRWSALSRALWGRSMNIVMRRPVFGAAKLLREFDSRVVDAAVRGRGPTDPGFQPKS